MDTCSIIPKVKNKQGEFVDSELFSSLLHYTKDREISKQYYAVGTSPEFLSKVSNKAKFDSNNEITFQSLRQLTKLKLDDEKVKQVLNKDIGAGVFSYNEAIPRLQSFNRNSPYNDKYMATIINRPDGKVELSVVDRNKTNTAQLNDNIANRSLQDRIKFFLNKAGVDFGFIEDSEKINGRYSTVNAAKTADSLYQLIKVANNEQIDGNLSEEAGHFAVGALGNNPLVKRLERLLSPDVQRSIMGDEYNTVAYRENPAREVAGYLVGKAINGEIDRRTAWYSLVSRIVSQIKRVFYTITGNDVAKAKIDSVRLAESIAKGFMSSDFQGTVEEALKTKETLFSAPDTNNVKVFKKIVDNLKLQTREMGAINKKLWQKYNDLESAVTAGKMSTVPSMFADIIAVDGMTDAIDLIAETLPEMIEKLNSVSFEEDAVSTENANKIREVRTFTRNALIIVKIVKDATLPNSLVRLNGVNEETIERLNKLSSDLHDALSGDNRLVSNLEQVEKKLYAKFLESVLGSDHIHRSARIIFNWKGVTKGEPLIKSIQAMDITVSDLITQLDSDITWFERYLASMSNNSDTVGQLHDRAVKEANKMANSITVNYQDKLRVLKKQAESKGVKDTRNLYEVSARSNKLTGNLVSKYVRGDWEDDWLEFKSQAIKEFKETVNIEGKSDGEKSMLFSDFFKPKMKSWHKQHSQFNKVTSSWEPNHKYLSTQYSKMSQNELWVLNQFMTIKQEIDGLIGDNGVMYRAPQFKGTTTDKIKNRMMFDNIGKATLYTLRNNLADTFLEDSDDTQFGSQLTYNTVNEDMFSNELQAEREKLNRIPLYGINKLKDSSQLSTDLFQSTLAYAGMASSYAALDSIVGMLEVGMEVLKYRNVEGLRDELTRKETSRSYTRLSKFMENNVYGINTKKLKIGKRLVLNKVVGVFSGIASKVFLGGNVVGGAANLTMGAAEIFKEAMSDEYFNIKDWKAAHINYWKDMPSNWINAGEDVKEDKVSLFIRHFNIKDEFDREARDWFTRKSKLVKLNPLGENLFLPYKAGEHYMQAMAFLAVANGTKLVDKLGNPISLYNAYDVVPLDKNKPELGKTLVLKQGIKKVDKDTGKLVDWIIEDESRYRDKCREINNRLHGIYNNSDKVAFQRTIYGGAFMAMRGYALGMLQRRFGASMYNTILDKDVEGSWRTFAKMLLSIRKTPSLTMRAILLPTSSKVKQEMLAAGYSANQYANMRRNFADLLFIAATFILKCMTAKPDDDDDDEDIDIGTATMYYFASRLFMEQSAYNAPWGMIKESQTITNILPAGAAVAIDMWDLANLFVSQEEYKSSGSTYEKGDLKWQHKVERLLPFYRSYLTMQNPYQASQSYQYGRATGGAR